MDAFSAWFDERRQASRCSVRRASLDALAGWWFPPESGNLVHDSGRFFSVEGLEVETDHREVSLWMQPILVQPEIGILGILTRTFNGERHYLMQAKVEPGNPNGLQLSPTVQATFSNYSRVHKGASVPYLEYFTSARNGRVLLDVLQSEQGSWFLHKRNRNMIVEVDGEVPARADFCWLSRAQIVELLRATNILNMDSRTVVSGILRPPSSPRNSAPLHPDAQILSWLTEAKTRYRLDRRRIPLSQVKGWIRSPEQISHEHNRYFTVIGVDVEAANREVREWSQPMLAPCERGISAFLGTYLNDEFHVLVHAHTEAGTFDVVEMGPTVSCMPANYAHLPPDRRPPYLDYVLSRLGSRTLLDVVHSEEGGRFYHAENRYLVIDAGDDVGLDVPDDYIWMTVPQLASFVPYGNYVNVAARSLLACMCS